MTPDQDLELRLEERLLLCCARTCLEPEVAERIRELCEQEVDWAYLLQISQKHGILPFLYQNLSATCAEAIPKAVLAHLRSQFYANSGSNLHYISELVRLLNLLAEQNIPAIPFKGPTLAVSIYKNVALRPFNDLDILVRKQDFAKASDLVIAQGYQVQEGRELLWESHFWNDNSGIELDLHQAVNSQKIPFPLTFDYLWQRLESVPLAGTTVACPSLEDLLIVLGDFFALETA